MNYTPYEKASSEIPVTTKIPNIYYKLRWKLLKPFHTRVRPTSFTVGEIICFMIIIIFNCSYGYIKQSEKGSGKVANIPL